MAEGTTPRSAKPTPEEIAACADLLEALAEDRGLLADVPEATRRRFLMAAGRVSRPERNEQRDLRKALGRRDRQEQRAADDAARRTTVIRSIRELAVYPTPALRPPPVEAAQLAPKPSNGAERATTAHPAFAADPAPEPGPPASERTASSPPEVGPDLRSPRKCYVCKATYRTLHFFYDQLCPTCGDENHTKRLQTANLQGRVAIVTGARVKIGYQAAMKLLRAGARVIVTTRFPHDAARRYAEEVDHEGWSDRLHIYGLDLRHTPSVERFAAHLTAHLDRLDFVLHNACQTVRRPPGYYAHLMAREEGPIAALPAAACQFLHDYDALRQRGEAPSLQENKAPQGDEGARENKEKGPQGGPSSRWIEAGSLAVAAAEGAFGAADIGLRAPALLSQIAAVAGDTVAGDTVFPEGRLDADQQQIDLRALNSWRLTLAEVPTVELFEVMLVNAIAPFVLSARLKQLMTRQVTGDKHIVNVSAMEGQFYRPHKTDKHPHTNMAKAALNMLTRTSAPDYLRAGIHMNSVDTGWVTDEDPADVAARKVEEHGFHPPLDITDGAARICDPIFAGLATGNHPAGLFFKDYHPTDW